MIIRGWHRLFVTYTRCIRQEWQMLRVFDGKVETEESDSEEERIFESGASFRGAAAAAVGCFT